MFECTNDTLELLTLDEANLSFGVLMSMFILKLFWTIGLTMSSVVAVGYSVFTNSLLDATIQNIREKEMMHFLLFFALYIAFIIYIFEKRSKNLLPPILVLILLSVNNRLFVSQEKNYEKLNAKLFCSYNIILSLFKQFSLVIEHNKSEVFHFSRLIKNNNLFLLDL